MKPSKHPREQERLAALQRYGVLDTPPEAAFDEVARLAATLCGTPIAVINLIDATRQWFKSEVGLGVRELPLLDSICAHAILEHDFVEIPDTLADSRLCDNPLCIGEPGLRFYAGALLKTPEGLPLGTLCVLDRMPRVLDDVQRAALQVLARQVMAQIELRRTLAEQQRLAERLALADRRKNDFLAMLAHELRNPLAPLMNAHMLLERTQRLASAGRQALAIAQRQTRQLARLVDDLLEVSRITRGKIELRPEPMDVRTAVRDATDSIAVAADERRQRVSVTLPDEPVTILADPARIAQVLENLLHNASKYTPDGGSIRVEVEPRPKEVVIRVTDSGIGIEPQHIPQLFELFQQIETTIDRAQGGLGIGLALVKRLVELHGGSVSAHSDGLGSGTTFTVTLPAESPMVVDPAEGSAAGSASAWRAGEVDLDAAVLRPDVSCR